MTSDIIVANTPTKRPEWHRTLTRYTRSSNGRAAWQLTNTLIPYVALWALMLATIRAGYPYWTTLLIAPIAAGLLVRTFIIFHDCCHGSFVSSRRANRIIGYITGFLTFTPFDEWQWAHLTHHASVNDLDRRGPGDITMMTVDEYLAAPWRERIAYRLFRNPLVMFILGPIYQFYIRLRWTSPGAPPRARRSVIITNIALLVLLVVAHMTIGLATFVAIQLPITIISGAAGIWLFYVQHQYHGAHWVRHDQWDAIETSVHGSSYYRLPIVLRWFTGDIGLHHVHHAAPRVPNYRLQRCYRETLELRVVQPLTLIGSLRSLFIRLWDEKEMRFVGFRGLRAIRRQRALTAD